MTKKQRRQMSIGWAVALVVTLALLVAGEGVSAAIAADGPNPPSAAAGDSPSASTDSAPSSTSRNQVTAPSALPRQARTTSEPIATPTSTPAPNLPPDSYAPPDGTKFNHPFVRSSASTIRQHVLRTVKSVPSGGSIRLAEFSLNDDTLADALVAAWKRGVVVQVVVNNHNLTNSIKTLPPSPSFVRLYKTLGHVRYHKNMSSDRVSFARICHASCRGHGGDVHYKMFLFSSAGRFNPRTGAEVPGKVKHWVTMMGSPNLTTKAAYGQWNHLDTYSNKATYDYYMSWFRQMKADKALKHPFEQKTTGSVHSWTFPKPGTTASTDPWMQGLNGIHCTKATGGTGLHGRTRIRIGAYTFYDDRGRWMAKKVRSLWNAGCDVAIEYSIMGDTVKKILYSPSGRGRIPMRQVVTFLPDGTINAYDHAKFITISGHYGSDHSAHITWTGTTNISDLGFSSDDSQQVWRSAARYNSYVKDFYTLWREPQAHVPSPTSRVGVRFGTKNATLGKGRYANLENN
ncbi:MAG: phospholipase D-like domain-containing protein [Marmoricola sp.]